MSNAITKADLKELLDSRDKFLCPKCFEALWLSKNGTCYYCSECGSRNEYDLDGNLVYEE